MPNFNTHALLLKCRPGSQFHFGKPPLDEQTAVDETASILHSDTLCSALIDVCSRLFPDFTDNLIEKFKLGDITISSASYFLDWKNGATTERLFFLPKPATMNFDKEKKTRKVAFISKGIWEQGVLPNSKQWVVFGKNPRFAMLKSEIPDHWPNEPTEFEFVETLTIPKVAVHKISKENSIYFQNNLVMPRQAPFFNTHFFVLLRYSKTFEQSADFSKIKMLFEWLKGSGIGGERSTGCGRLEAIEWTDFQLTVTRESAAKSLLSLCSPSDATDLSHFTFFKTLNRGGRTTGFSKDLILGRVKMIAEGAVLTQGGEPTGRLIELEKTPIHAIYRIGRPFLAPLHENFASDSWMN